MRTIFCLAVLIVSSAVSASATGADETLAKAKDLYASAAYDEALAVLEGLHASAPAETRSIAEYRVFCLLALDRRDEARKNIEAILYENPQYIPSPDQASPRIQNVFRDVRRQSLPKIVMERYALAKASFERKDPRSMQQFEDVLALLDDPDVADVSTLNDLKTVVSAFRDLTKAIASAPPTELPAARSPASAMTDQPPGLPSAPSEPPSAQPELIQVFTAADADVVPPTPRVQTIPPWYPTGADAAKDFRGALELLIDEDGSVVSAALRAGIHPAYNRLLLRAARDWKFDPAKKQGKPVRYLKVVDIHLQPTRR